MTDPFDPLGASLGCDGCGQPFLFCECETDLEDDDYRPGDGGLDELEMFERGRYGG